MEENKTVADSKKKKIKPWMIFTAAAVVLFVVLGVVMVVKMSEAMTGIGTPVEVTEAWKGSIAQTVDGSGTVSSEETKVYFADVSAEIESLSAASGEYVKKGEVLLAYNTKNLEEQMKQAELEAKISTYGADAVIAGIDDAQKKAADASANYEDAKKYIAHYTECVGQISSQLNEATELAGKQAELEKQVTGYTETLNADPGNKKAAKALKEAQKEYERVTKKLESYDIKALEDSLASCSGDLAEYKALLKEYEMTKESDPAAPLSKAQQAAVKESARFSEKSAKDRLDAADEGVKAEFDGVVSNVMAVQGQTVTEGMELFTVHNTGKLKVTLTVTKYDVQKLAEGQKAEITINGKGYTGSVSRVSRIATANDSGAAVVEADVHIDNPDASIILGMEAKVSVQTAEESDVLIIPAAGVNYSSEGIFCYILADGMIEKREIETGLSDDEYVQVLSGLSEGDKVVTNVTSVIEEGMKATEINASALNSEEVTEE